MEKLKIELTQNDLQYILDMLVERPYKEVSELISDIFMQAKNQMEKTEE